MDLRRELPHALRDRLAVGEHDVAAGQDLLVVAVDSIVARRDPGRVPRAVVVDDVGHDEVGIESVGERREVVVASDTPRRPSAGRRRRDLAAPTRT